MKRMCNMRMREYCCCPMMMAMTMKGSVYIIGIEQEKKKHYEDRNVSAKYVNLVFREYALDDSDIFELGRLAAAFNTAPADEKYEKLEELFAKYSEVIEKLKAKGIIGEDLKKHILQYMTLIMFFKRK